MARDDRGGVKGLRHIATEDNPFAGAVGALILNFGFVELRSIQWILSLDADPPSMRKVVKQPFRERCGRIRQLVDDTDLDPALKLEANRVWQEVEGLYDFRNNLAHNPLMLGWRDRPAGEGEPDVVAILKLKNIEETRGNVVSLQEIHRNTRALGALATRIQELSKSFGVTDEVVPRNL